MGKILKMHTRCGVKIDVEEAAAGWLLTTDCPSGQPTGMQVSRLLDMCMVCPKLGTAQDVAAPPPPDEEPPPVSELPAPAPPPPMGNIAPPPAAAAMPDGLPAPDGSGAEGLVGTTQHSPTIDLTALIAPPPKAAAAMPEPAPPPEMPAAAPPPAEPEIPSVAHFIDKKGFDTQQQAGAPSIENVLLPNGMSLAQLTGGQQVDIEAVMRTIPGLPFGSSEGGYSPHKLQDTTCKRRLFLAQVMGLRQVRSRKPLDFGTLAHACLAMRYKYGYERQWEPIDAVAREGGSELAAEVKQLLMMQLEKYQTDEWNRWCPQAVEENLIAWLPVKIGNKTIPIPLSCRVDMIVALKQPGEPHPPQPPPQGVYLLDWKFHGVITYDLVTGYGMDWQFLCQSAIYKLGGYDSVFGRLRGVMVSIGQKRKSPGFDDFQRLEAPISHGAIETFIEEELKPLVAETHTWMADEARRQDMKLWPMDHRQCVGRWGPCDYFDLCDSGNDLMYRVDPHRIVTMDKLAAPPSGWKPTTGVAEAPDVGTTKKKPAAKKKSAAKLEPQAEAMAVSLISQIENDDRFTPLRKENFLTPGHTLPAVKKQLAATLKSFYEPLAAAKTKFGFAGLEWRIMKTGMTWKDPDGASGRVAWGALAEWICVNAWFNLAESLPEGA